MKSIAVILVLLTFFSCKKDEITESITNPDDYQSFLFSSNNKTYISAWSEKEFWSKRLRSDSSGIGDLGPLASAYTTLYETTGDIVFLKNAEKLYQKATAISAHNKDAYTRSLSQNYISQHRFKEAKDLLEKSYAGVSNKKATELLLFDVYMELGEYNKADTMLGKIKNNFNYNYLIRLAKWNDHNGKLNAAIRNLENAKNIADSRKNKQLQIWTYTNLADFYGHAGRIKESYGLYLKTLQLQADNTYSKKKIAWIVYSYEKNTKEANRILDSIMVNYKSPDYFLFKAEMAAYEGNDSISNKQKEYFVNAVEKDDYSSMYASYLIEIFSETKPEKALKLAEKEVKNRGTAATYQLLAYAQLKTEEKEKALNTIIDYVENNSFNPRVLYYSALIFKANGKEKKVRSLQSQLENAAFELGPLFNQKKNKLFY